MLSSSNPDLKVHSLGGFEAVIAAHPDRVAITHRDQQITFAELGALVEATAAALARTLEKTLLPAGSFIPVFVGRDFASIVVIHAGFLAGVPIGVIDATLPEAEINQRLAALGEFGAALVHDESCAELVPAGTTIVPAARVPGDRMEPVEVDPDGDAFVIFTSGSTGRAKGVVHGRRILIDTLLDPFEQVLPLDSGPLACIAPFHWVAGIGVTVQLLTGRSIAILELGDPSQPGLVEALRSTKSICIMIPPSLAVWLAGTNSGPPLPDLAYLRLGGEPVTPEHIRALATLIEPSANLSFVWGASEVFRGFLGEVQPGVRDVESVPMGPVVDDSIRLESSDDDPAPAHGGTVGEIIVRGELAKRYLGQPELTALCFGVDPDGVRFWRSGDLAEQLADGTLFLRGRIDDMVKINGKLVEPAESLALLRAYPGLRSVEVLPHTYASGRIVLVAHVVADDNVSPDALRRMLLDRLPVHVIPGVMMRHDQLPLTDRGKVDRQTLQKLQPVAWLETDTRAAGSELETYLLGQLRAIIETDGVGVDDDIWFVGLDSLGATELVASIAEVGLGILAPTVLLEHRTIRSLARQLRDGIDERATDAVTFNPETPGDPFFCVTGAGGTAIRFQPLAGCFSTERPLVVIEAHGMHARGKPDRTITAMAQRVVSAVDERQPTGTITLLGHSAGGFVAWEAAQQLAQRGRHVRVVMIDTHFVSKKINLRGTDWGPAPPGTGRMQRAMRSARLRASALKRRWWEQRPGPPRADTLRYIAFKHVLVRALHRYRPRPARFPILYLAAGKHSNAGQWSGLVENLTITNIAGDHFTMLENPNVADVALAITQWIDSPAGSGN